LKQIALIGATASGKSALAVELALRYNCQILSLDSLSVYREIDIASAKPSKNELSLVKHYGIDEIYPNEHFSAALFFDIYKKAKYECEQSDKNLIIVGGTGFYLYALTNGLSNLPAISNEALKTAGDELLDKKAAFDKLSLLDPEYAVKIAPNDSYRIQKAFEIYYQTGEIPTKVFKSTNKEPLCPSIPIFEILFDRNELREKIKFRTQKMFAEGLVDEVKKLENKYGREPKSMKSIGIVEILDFLDGKITSKESEELITIHTGQLAKRQETFNRSKFANAVKDAPEKLKILIGDFFDA